MGQEYSLVSQDAQAALREFSQEFAMALAQGPVEPWARANGLYKASRALRTTYPVPVSAAGYKDFAGDLKYRGLFEKSIDLRPKTWQDGVAELASIVEAPDFTGWNEQPTAMAMAAQSLPNEIIAAALEANPTGWDEVAFFSGTHPVNLYDDGKGTFDNDATGEATVETLDLALQHFQGLKGPNGKYLGLRATHVFHPPSQTQTWKKILEQDLLIQTVASTAPSASSFGSVNNIYKGAVIPVVCNELTDTHKFYVAALNKPGMYPWIVQDEGAPEEIRQDKTSALYQTTLKIGVAYILRGNGALALPQCIKRFSGT